MNRPNHYAISEIVEYNSHIGPDGVFYPVEWKIIGYRKTINGNEVNDDGSPKTANQRSSD